jgi:hypothetical protein
MEAAPSLSLPFLERQGGDLIFCLDPHPRLRSWEIAAYYFARALMFCGFVIAYGDPAAWL